MPFFSNDGTTMYLFIFNHIIVRFKVPKVIFTSHGVYFQDHMIQELATKLVYFHEYSTHYHPQANEQVEAIN